MGMFDAPLPGQSLTTTPKNYPWESPPEMSNLNKAIDYYMEKLSSEETIDNLLEMLELKTPVTAMVNAITTVGVMQGLHSVDVKLLVSPMIHEYIRAIGKRAQVDIEDELDAPASPEDNSTTISMLQRAIDRIETSEDEEDDEGVELMRQTAKMLDDTAVEPEMEMQDEEPEIPEAPAPQMPQEEPRGLMSRRGPM